jgi:hypothetical protein
MIGAAVYAQTPPAYESGVEDAFAKIWISRCSILFIAGGSDLEMISTAGYLIGNHEASERHGDRSGQGMGAVHAARDTPRPSVFLDASDQRASSAEHSRMYDASLRIASRRTPRSGSERRPMLHSPSTRCRTTQSRRVRPRHLQR